MTDQYHQEPRSSMPPPPPRAPVYAERERPTATGPFVCGVIGTVVGLIPILGLIAIPLGIIAFVLGVIAWRRKPERKKLARAATILGVTAIALGIIGTVVVSNAFDELEDDLECIGDADTAEELEACD